jgi:hypothetical protein
MVLLNPLGGISPALGLKLMIILGFTNLISLILVWFTCRCRHCLIKSMKPNSFYSKLFNLHCLFWKILATSVIFHVIIGLMTFGIPI